MALGLARGGERVAVVSGGDAGVFGMASAVFEAVDADPALADVPVRVLPGVSAVQAVAARAGAPVGADFAVVSLSDRLKPWSVVEKRLRAIAEADLVLAVYNPASRSRTEQVVTMQKVLLEHRSPDTVVVVGRDVGRAEESLDVTTLGALDPAAIDMKCLLLVGATSTRVGAGGAVWTPRYVENRAFYGLAVGTSPLDARLVQNNVLPLREPLPVVGERRRIQLPAVGVRVPAGQNLYLLASPFSETFVGMSSRTPGVIVLEDTVLHLRRTGPGRP